MIFEEKTPSKFKYNSYMLRPNRSWGFQYQRYVFICQYLNCHQHYQYVCNILSICRPFAKLVFSIADHQNQVESCQNPFCQCHYAKGRKLSVITDVKCALPYPTTQNPTQQVLPQQKFGKWMPLYSVVAGIMVCQVMAF